MSRLFSRIAARPDTPQTAFGHLEDPAPYKSRKNLTKPQGNCLQSTAWGISHHPAGERQTPGYPARIQAELDLSKQMNYISGIKKQTAIRRNTKESDDETCKIS